MFKQLRVPDASSDLSQGCLQVGAALLVAVTSNADLYMIHGRSELFTDLTLVTEDLREARAHRLVVSSGSKVLQKILASKTLERDPVIFLSGILHDDLTFILQFLYYGDVTVPQV